MPPVIHKTSITIYYFKSHKQIKHLSHSTKQIYYFNPTNKFFPILYDHSHHHHRYHQFHSCFEAINVDEKKSQQIPNVALELLIDFTIS